MKGLTLYDPWATLVVLGAKRYETRSWKTKYRGLIAIRASKTFTGAMADLCHTEPFKAALSELEDWPNLGCIIGVVDLEDCRPTREMERREVPDERELAFGDWSEGRFAWKLSSPWRLAIPVPCRGYQGLWKVPSDLEAAVAT